MALQDWTLEEAINHLNSGYKIDVFPGSSISWTTPQDNQNYFDDGNSPEIAGLQPLNSLQLGAIQKALATYADIGNFSFEYVGNNVLDGQLAFQNSSSLGASLAKAYSPDTMSFMYSTVWFNSAEQSLQSPDEQGYFTMLRETGRALGLSSMSDTDGTSTWADTAASLQDSQLYSVMSQFNAHPTGQADWVGSDQKQHGPETLMMNDIATLQQIYGANTQTRNGNTNYGFNATSDVSSLFNSTINGQPIICIYDAGRLDTLDVSGFTSTSRIDLRDGQFSDANQMTNNISIAHGTIIENAITGAGNDTITGNDANNLLESGARNDTLYGGEGTDVLRAGAGNDIFHGGDNSDIFIFDNIGSEADTGTDIIMDFQDGIDFIDLRGYTGAYDITDANFASMVSVSHDVSLGQFMVSITNQDLTILIKDQSIAGFTIDRADFWV